MQHLQPNSILQGGKYRIERMLGQGGFGITYLAIQVSLNRYVAIKEFFMKDFSYRDENSKIQTPTTGSSQQVAMYRKKFVKEAHNLAKLSHPNIVGVIDIFAENNTEYYVMPYLSGGSLHNYVKTHGSLSEAEALKYIKQIASALKYMHKDMHLCHYDVKPANILLDGNGNAVLIDFGISKNYDSEGHETSTTPVGLSEGYAPIEQYQQSVDEFSPSSDVYALGATLYFLLHGKRPVSSILRVGGEKLLMSSKLSQSTKDMITASMKISRQERAQSTDVFLGGYQVDNDSEETIIATPHKKVVEKVVGEGFNASDTSTNSSNDMVIWTLVLLSIIVLFAIVFGGLKGCGNKAQQAPVDTDSIAEVVDSVAEVDYDYMYIDSVAADTVY